MTDSEGAYTSVPLMKLICLTILFLSGWMGSLQAAFVTFDTGGARGHQIVLSDGATRVLATTSNPASTVKIGYLTTAGDSSTFQLFAESPIGNSPAVPMPAGFLSQSSGNNSTGTAGISVIADKVLVLWVFGQSGQQGMFTSEEWKVPATFGSAVESELLLPVGRSTSGGTPPVVTTIPLPGFNAASYTAPVSVTVGSLTNTNASSYILGSPIPEPSVFSLAGIIAAVAFRRKRAWC